MIAGALLWVAPAGAVNISDCSGSHAPVAYYDEGCSNECTFDGSHTLSCDFSALSNPIEITVVQDYDNLGTRNFSAFGTLDIGGGDFGFCCHVQDAGHVIEIVDVDGTDYDDTINFIHSTHSVKHPETKAHG